MPLLRLPTYRSFLRFALSRPFRIALPLAIVLGLICSGTTRGQPDLRGLTLDDALATTLRVFRAGDYQRAHHLFEALEDTFGEEEELRTPEARRLLLPARGYAAWASGHPREALGFFEEYLAMFPARGPVHSFVLYTLAEAYQSEAEDRKAANRFAEFITAYPGTGEAGLAGRQRAHLLFQLGETEEALTWADRFFQSGAAAPLRYEVRLRALQELVEAERFGEAAELLESTSWRVHSLPERAALAFRSLQVGDALLAEGEAGRALRAYRQVPPYHELVEHQRHQLARARERLQEQRETGRGLLANAWITHRQRAVMRLERRLRDLESREDYTPRFLLRYGQAFLAAGRPREAHLIFHSLAGDESLPARLREEARYRGILALYTLDKTRDTLAAAREFQERHPDSERAPEVLYLVARTEQERRRFGQAAALFADLLASYPDHALVPRWQFTRAFNLARLGEYEDARAGFTAFRHDHPDHPLALRAAYWHALTQTFEKEYGKALEEMEALAAKHPDHPLYPELRYRIATALYGQQDYARAREAIEDFLATYPGHPRAPEATVLRGDILMGEGELLAATRAFARVTPAAEGLYPYAVFQQGKIFRALERHDLLIRHFTSYLREEEPRPLPRRSEAVYWLGWAHLQEGRPREALAVFDEAIRRFGNDPDAGGAEGLVGALGELRREIHAEAGPAPLPAHPLVQADSFAEWRTAEAERAREAGELTWYTRLQAFAARERQAAGDVAMARTLLLEVDEAVPLGQLDPAVLAEIGLLHAEEGYAFAERYFQRILEEFPDHPARAEAWYGLALLSRQQGAAAAADRFLARLEERLPHHPRTAQARILRGAILTDLGEYADAESVLQSVLRLPGASGRLQAEALAGLARLKTAEGRPRQAIPYWQRIYTLYRAYPALTAEAYYQSARRFAEIGKPRAALRSLREMLALPDERATRLALRAEDFLAELEKEFPALRARGPQEERIP
jgi:tetratricopeptide (TPR) repeat protein